MFTNMGLCFRNRRNYVVYVLEDNCKKLKFNDFIVNVLFALKPGF
ncbi:unknown [Bacteroides sp. CAG:144]|nr:unknown [Bacteroides sp. CAG:144]